MSLGGKKGPDRVTTVGTEKSLNPQNQDLANQWSDTLGRYGQGYQGQRVADMDPMRNWGLQRQYQLAQQGSPLVPGATDATMRTMNYTNPIAGGLAGIGGYAGAQGVADLAGISGGGDYAVNPHLAGATRAALDPIAEAYRYGTRPGLQADASALGRYRGAGGGMMGEGGVFDRADQGFARQLGNVGMSLANQSAEAERNRQMQAASSLGQMGFGGLGAAGSFMNDAQRIQQAGANAAPGARAFDYYDAAQAQRAGQEYENLEQRRLYAERQAFEDPFNFARQGMAGMTPYFLGSQNTMQTTTSPTFRPSMGDIALGAGIDMGKAYLTGGASAPGDIAKWFGGGSPYNRTDMRQPAGGLGSYG
jgi:hypothetical protein